MREVVRAPKAPAVLCFDARRREPIGALPAVALTEYGTHAGKLVIDRRSLRRSRVGAFLIRIVDDEHVTVGFLVLRDHVALARVRAVAPGVDGGHVDAGLAFDDPFRQLPTRAAGCRDAEAVTLVEPEIFRAPGGTDERAAVGRVGDRSVDDVLDAGRRERGHASNRGLDVRQQAIEIAIEQALTEPVRYPVREARRRTGLIGPEDPPQAFLAQIIRLIRLAQHSKFRAPGLPVGGELGRFVVNDVLVFDRDRGHVDAEQSARLARVVAGRADHMFRDDIALVGRDVPLARGRALDARDLGLFVDFRAAIARAFTQGHRKVGGRDMPVVRVVKRADDLCGLDAVAEIDQGP